MSGSVLDAVHGSITQHPSPHSTGVRKFCSLFFLKKKETASAVHFHQHFSVLKKETPHLFKKR